MPSKPNYTCDDHREQMRLLGLKWRLSKENLNHIEKDMIEAEIAKLEKRLQLN